MNKTELTQKVAKETGLTKSKAGEVVDAVLNEMTKELAAGKSVAIPGFGSFAVKARAAHAGINPMTREAITIPASHTVSFHPGKALKDAVN